MYDAIIVGGGPAGLSAALTLGRSRRTALLCDAGAGRNRSAPHSHGYLTRDGLPPDELRALSRSQLTPYSDVTVREVPVLSAERAAKGFAVQLPEGGQAQGRRLLLATGVTDVLPDIAGLDEAWGISAFNCPYCDGFEAGGGRTLVLGGDAGALRLAVQMFRLCDELVLCTGGARVEDEGLLQLLLRQGMAIRREPIEHLEAPQGLLKEVTFTDGSSLACDSAFLRPPTRQNSDLPEQLGCALFDDGSIQVNDFQQTTVPGIFAAGDLARREGLPFAATQIVHAASAGALGAVVIDQELLGEEIQHIQQADS